VPLPKAPLREPEVAVKSLLMKIKQYQEKEQHWTEKEQHWTEEMQLLIQKKMQI